MHKAKKEVVDTEKDNRLRLKGDNCYQRVLISICKTSFCIEKVTTEIQPEKVVFKPGKFVCVEKEIQCRTEGVIYITLQNIILF